MVKNSISQDKKGRTPLTNAALKGNTKLVEILLENNAKIDIQDHDGNTALSLCGLEQFNAILSRAKNVGFESCKTDCKLETRILLFSEVQRMKETGRREQLVKVLLKNGADPNVKDINGQTALTFAATWGFDHIAGLLLKNNASIDVQDTLGSTPLMATARVDTGELDKESAAALERTVQVLLKNDASLDLTDIEGNTALQIAELAGNLDFAKIVQKYAVDVKFIDAVKYDNDQDFSLLLENGVNVNVQDKYGRSPLIWAALKGNTGLVEVLLANNASVDIQDQEGNTALMLAGFEEFYNVTNKAAKEGFKRCKTDCKAEFRSLMFNIVLKMKKSGVREDIVKLLLEHGANPNIQESSGQTALTYAASFGFDRIAELCLKHNASVDIQDESGATPLMFAASIDKEGVDDVSWEALGKTIEILLRNGASIDIENKKGQTAVLVAEQVGNVRFIRILQYYTTNVKIFEAIKSDNAEEISSLLREGVNVDVRDKEGKSPLIHAAFKGNTTIVGILLEGKADVNIQDNNGNTALMLAGFKEFTEALNKASSLGFDDCKTNCKAQLRVLLFSHVQKMKKSGIREELVTLLLRHGADPNIQERSGQTALIYAAIYGFDRVVEILLKNNALVNVQDESGATPIMYAASIDHEGVDTESWDALGTTIEILLKNGASLDTKNNKGKTALMIAEQVGNDRFLEKLQIYNENTEWLEAVKSNDTNEVNLLLENGVNIDAQDKDGKTALIHAALSGNTFMVDLLLSSNASVDIQDSYGHTAMGLAGFGELDKDVTDESFEGFQCFITNCSEGNGEDFLTGLKRIKKIGKRYTLVKILMMHGANPDIKDNSGKTALGVNAAFGFDRIVDYLIKNNASVNTQDNSGATPLMYAVNIDRSKVDESTWKAYGRTVAILLKNKAALDIANKEGKTALELVNHIGGKFLARNELEFDATSINVQDKNGKTPLIHAAFTGNTRLVEILLASNAKVDIQDNDGNTALLLAGLEDFDLVLSAAISNGEGIRSQLFSQVVKMKKSGIREELSKLLLANGANPDIESVNGQTALTFAAAFGFDQIAELLLMYNASVNIQNEIGTTPLMFAAEINREGVNDESWDNLGRTINILLKNGAMIDIKNKKGKTAIMIAEQVGNDRFVEIIQAHDFNVKLFEAAKTENLVELSQLLLENGINVDIQDQKGFTLLHHAAVAGNLKLVKIILAYNASLDIFNSNGQTALSLAAAKGFDQIADILLQNGASVDLAVNSFRDLDVNGFTSLMIVASTDQKSVDAATWSGLGRTAEVLLKNGASLDIKNNKGENVWMLALGAGNERFAKIVEDQTESAKLFDAVKAQDSEKLSELLVSGANIDAQDKQGKTPLIHAALKSDAPMIEILLANDVNLNIQDNKGYTALLYAGFEELMGVIDEASVEGFFDGCIPSCNDEIRKVFFSPTQRTELTSKTRGKLVELLLKNGADPDIQVNTGQTALTYAAYFGLDLIASHLLKYNASIDIQDVSGATPLILAASIERKDIDDASWAAMGRTIQILLNNGASLDLTNNEGKTALEVAEEVGNNRFYDIVQNHIRRDDIENIKLLEAIKSDNVKEIKGYLASGANVDIKDKDGRTPLILAALNGSERAIQILLSRDANVDIQDNEGNTALMLAGLQELNEITKRGVDSGLGKEDLKSTIFAEVLKVKESGMRKKLVTILLKNTMINLNIQNVKGQTALTLAAYYGFDGIAELLLKNGATVDIQDVSGTTPLMYTARTGKAGIDEESWAAFAKTIKVLLRYGASVEIKNNNGETALSLAEQLGNERFAEIVQNYDENYKIFGAVQTDNAAWVSLLLASGVNVNFQDEQGRTPLIHASLKGNIKIAELLLDSKASVDIQDNDGRTALMLAGQQGLIQVLSEYANENCITTPPTFEGPLSGPGGEGCKTDLFYEVFRIRQLGNHLKLVKILLEHGSNPDIKDNTGKTALSYAASYGLDQVVELLIQINASIDIQDSSGNTPLMLVASVNIDGVGGETFKGFGRVAQILLLNGASLSVENEKGENALAIAERFENTGRGGFTEIVEKHVKGAILIGGEQLARAKTVPQLLAKQIRKNVGGKSVNLAKEVSTSLTAGAGAGGLSVGIGGNGKVAKIFRK